MTEIILHRTYHAKTMRRFYRLDVQPIYSGNGALIREWGRIGRAGQVRMVPYAGTAGEAHEALAARRRHEGAARLFWYRGLECHAMAT